ncbi:MAG: bifunctional 2-C-methyl-D-erythritol 4-phosphate cytidylyltransferase/2-C-methyl-D-erythritol 2,4-cyclodiphosphate synthase [Rhodospirillales bacterium]|nr:bifunctional 2-C-methyl-D-erythritol 4-phosphate cytidylyltransferase/2-C-methyl-D-erythritol 2,4-cyclodiphosphate synthase [Rhodospirillales bacterium]
MKKTIALIVAAGRGHRFGGEMPKQYIAVNGTPVLRQTVIALQRHPAISQVRVVIHPDDLPLYQEATKDLGLEAPVFGGALRQDSVRLGLQQLSQNPPDLVLIHDGARPYVSEAIIDRVLAALETVPGVVPTLPLTDTIKRVAGDRIMATEDRAALRRAQTPQGFRYGDILAAHLRLAGQNLTDDAAVCEAAGLEVVAVDGDPANIKITTPEDVVRRLGGNPQMQTRTGSGFDVHRFTSGDQVILCGVAVPHSQSLDGHSDADVGLHALTDALLGAIGEGDIGHFFPPSDARWRGASSDQFVSHAVDLIRGRGGRIVNVDITLICEAPKIGPHRLQMRDRVAEILGLAGDRVNVKATTTEQLGFTGRREGIAAQAVANVEISSAG